MKCNYQILNQWFCFLTEIRSIFSKKLNLVEVSTPSLVASPGIEEHIQVFKVLSEGKENPIHSGYLPTSPEFALKKLLGRGFKNIFEISPSFRFEEKTKHHNPEFTILEWYRVDAAPEDIIKDIKKMLEALYEKGFILCEKPQIIETSFSKEFKEKLNFNLKPETSRQGLAGLCKSIGLYFSDEDSFNDLFHRIVLDKIESEWPKEQVTIVNNFPPSGSALAVINKDGWADRFEVYWKGLELGNAYNELLDASEQNKRFDETNSKRCQKGWEVLPKDKGLSAQLSKISKPTVGIAVGLERLFMVCQGIEDIGQLKI